VHRRRSADHTEVAQSAVVVGSTAKRQAKFPDRFHDLGLAGADFGLTHQTVLVDSKFSLPWARRPSVLYELPWAGSIQSVWHSPFVARKNALGGCDGGACRAIPKSRVKELAKTTPRRYRRPFTGAWRLRFRANARPSSISGRFGKKATFFEIFAVTKSLKVGTRPFPKQAGVGTYRPRPDGLWGQGLPSQEATGRKRRPRAFAKPFRLF
jgi:hypothetical protein